MAIKHLPLLAQNAQDFDLSANFSPTSPQPSWVGEVFIIHVKNASWLLIDKILDTL
jgi:hypothetical protein